jgi:hypothetical protein
MSRLQIGTGKRASVYEIDGLLAGRKLWILQGSLVNFWAFVTTRQYARNRRSFETGELSEMEPEFAAVPQRLD